MFSCMPGIEHDQNEYENGRMRGILWNNPLANKLGMVEDGLFYLPIKVLALTWQGCIVAHILHMTSCITSTLLHHHLLSLSIIYEYMPYLSIFCTYSMCHHTIFIHWNVVLVYKTFKRKWAIADCGGAQAKYLEKVVAPNKSNSPLGVVAISPNPQNTPTLADSSPTTLVISDAPTQQTPTTADTSPTYL